MLEQHLFVAVISSDPPVPRISNLAITIIRNYYYVSKDESSKQLMEVT